MAKKKGFTLIELLVVIAIIALLLSILLPALTKVKKMTRQLLCMVNMRSQVSAMMVYTADNNGELPMSGSRNKLGLLNGVYPYAPYSDVRILSYLGAKNAYPMSLLYSPMQWCGDDSKLKPFESFLDVFVCPAIAATQQQIIRDIYDDGGYPESYSVNTLITGYDVYYNGSIWMPNTAVAYKKGSARLSRITQTDRTLLYVDTRMNNVVGGRVNRKWGARFWYDVRPAHFVKIGEPFISSWGGTKELWGRSGYGFADGHVESLKTQFTAGGTMQLDPDFDNDDAIAGIKWSAQYNW